MNLSRARLWLVALLLGTAYSVLGTPALHAHPVPKRAHDRVITVRLTPAAVVVDYRLEVDDWTVVFVDLPAVSDQVDLTKLEKPRDFYDAFTRCYGPILADNLIAKLDGKALTFTCVKHGHQLTDSLRCDFVFEAKWQPAPGEPHTFAFQEGNYELEAGLIRLSLANEEAVTVAERSEPSEELKNRAAIDLRPGDDARLRKASATFTVSRPPAAAEAPPPSPPSEPPAPPSGDEPARSSLLALLLDSQQGFAVLLALAALFGALHALTPGHGKTLVAAYLVGERGTIWHALLLGLVTTLTHTGAVLVLAAVVPWFFPEAVPAQVQSVLGMVGGLLIAGTGFWLLMRRLGGQSDHFHLGSHGHHHHDHTPPTGRGSVGWMSLVLMGISGGIVPCWDAIIMFFFAVSAHRVWLGLPLLLAFSAGLAGVLILIGILVVTAKGYAQARLGNDARLRRVFRALPIASAVAVIVLGLWLCRDSLPSWTAPPAPAASAPP